MIETTEATFEVDVKASPASLAVAYFTASWCGPCRMLKPVLTQLEEENEGLTICRIDVDSNSELAKEFGIMSVPTLLLFKDGKLVDDVVGIKPRQILQTLFDNYL
jgi:thioredoxin 1